MTAWDVPSPSASGTSGDGTDFLYPFIESQESDPQTLLADLAASAQAKAAESAALRRTTLAANADLLNTAAAEMARRFTAGGRPSTFGNGGSSTDAATLAASLAGPPTGRPLQAWCLTADQAVLSDLGNGVELELIFVRQLMARRFTAGGRLFTFGNGGSSSDAATLAALFACPPTGRPLPAWCLTADQAVLTVLGNDVEFELIFARQLIARTRHQNIAVALST